MNKWEKQVQQSLLRDEQQVLRILKKAYESVLADIDAKIGEYAIRILADEEDTAAIYQLRHQQVLREQVEKIIGDLHWKSYDTIHSYLEGTYENGFIGAMYSIHKQGIPLLLPLNQQNIVRAVTTNSKISVGLYTRLGKDIDVLKTIIAAETTRGIATGSTWHETAVQIRAKGQIPYYNAMRIARTEGHRVQCEGQMDACQDAKAHGADMVKQWDAALDKRTRPLHRQLDGQIRELEEPFEIAGYHAMQPGAFDVPEMDIHCRCAMLQRARWALDEEELETLKERAEYYGLDKTEQFEDFKRKYLDAVEDAARNQPKTLDFSGGSGIIIEKECTIHPDKINRFFLQPGAKHSQEFFDVGYTKNDFEKLQEDLLNGFDYRKATDKKKSDNGSEKFSIFMELGVDKKKSFRTVWQKDTPNSVPRIITAHREDEKNV